MILKKPTKIGFGATKTWISKKTGQGQKGHICSALNMQVMALKRRKTGLAVELEAPDEDSSLFP